MAKNIFVLFDCDVWKSRDSMRIHLVTTSTKKLHKAIRDRIAKGDFFVDGEENPKEALKLWKDIVASGLEPGRLQDRLTYAATAEFIDGEIV